MTGQIERLIFFSLGPVDCSFVSTHLAWISSFLPYRQIVPSLPDELIALPVPGNGSFPWLIALSPSFSFILDHSF